MEGCRCQGAGSVGGKPCGRCSVLKHWSLYREPDQIPKTRFFQNLHGVIRTDHTYAVFCPSCKNTTVERIDGIYITTLICSRCGRNVRAESRGPTKTFTQATEPDIPMKASRETVLQEVTAPFTEAETLLQEEYAKATGAKARALSTSLEAYKKARESSLRQVGALCDRLDHETEVAKSLENRIVEVERENTKHAKDLAEERAGASRRAGEVESLRDRLERASRQAHEATEGLQLRKRELEEAKTNLASARVLLASETRRYNETQALLAEEKIKRKAAEEKLALHKINADLSRPTQTPKGESMTFDDLLREVQGVRADNATLMAQNAEILRKLDTTTHPKETADMTEKNTSNAPAPTNLLQKLATSSVAQTLTVDGTAAAWRIAGSQFVKLVKEPIIALLMRHMSPNDDSLRPKLAEFLDTELGTAILSSLLSVALSSLPATNSVSQGLSRELRIAALSRSGDALADVLMEPLRKVAAMYLQGVPTTPSNAGELSGESTGLGIDFNQTARREVG